MAYVEKKKIGGKTYYYLTENKRVGGKWKKTRKYLGVHTPAGFEKPRKKKIKPILTEKQRALIERIKKNYSKKHEISPKLWKEERDRLVSFIYNTNAIEGNSLTLDETDSVLAGKKVKAKAKDVKEAKNMKKCVDFIFQKKGDVNEEVLLKLHGMQMKGVLSSAGEYRRVDVRVGSYYCPRHEDVPRLMKKFFEWYDNAKNIMHPFELAALTHLKLVRIHPFRDGNGRIARLLMNLVLFKHGFPLLNIFNEEKIIYYLVLREVDYKKRFKPFVKYLHAVFVKQYKEYAQ